MRSIFPLVGLLLFSILNIAFRFLHIFFPFFCLLFAALGIRFIGQAIVFSCFSITTYDLPAQVYRVRVFVLRCCCRELI